MGPMSDVTMLRRLCVADFGHAMSALHCRWPKVWQISARAKPKPSIFEVRTSNNQAEPFYFLHMGHFFTESRFQYLSRFTNQFYVGTGT
jgi:hypothetical protein